jgi:hypothetical protein
LFKPADVLSQMRRAYLNCLTYKGQGFVRTTDARYSGEAEKERITRFWCLFKRPNLLRYSWREQFGAIQSTLWCDGIGIFQFSAGSQTIDRAKTLNSALADLVGPAEAASGIAHLLVGTTAEQEYLSSDSEGFIYAGTESDGSILCHRLTALKLQRGSPLEINLWISCDSLLLRKSSETCFIDYARSAALDRQSRWKEDPSKQHLLFNDDPVRNEMLIESQRTAMKETVKHFKDLPGYNQDMEKKLLSNTQPFVRIREVFHESSFLDMDICNSKFSLVQRKL